MAMGMKQFLIQYNLQMAGDKIIVKNFKSIDRSANKSVKSMDVSSKKYEKNLKKIGKQQEKIANGMGRQEKAAKTLGQQWAGLAGRAMLVVPVWMLMRNIYMSFVRTITDSLKAYADLEDQLARIKTVVQGTASSIDTQMDIIKTTILDTARDSRIALKDLGEGFYFLKTANLSATEAIAAFKPTVSLATGTMNSMAESARAVAGIYNTMGKYLGDNLTVTQKFQKIADMLAYTYATQDVQLSELIQSYTKLAPYVTGITDDFTSLVSMLGFVNTRLLRGGRAGRLLGRAILQLTKNARQLRDNFGIVFDPKKPIDFLGVLGQIRKAMNITGKLTAEQGEKLREVFATRGGVPVRIFIEHFERLQQTIKLAGENVEGFAERMETIKMGTLSAQGARFKNVMADLAETFITAATGTDKLANALKSVNDWLNRNKILFELAGESIRKFYWGMRAISQLTAPSGFGGLLDELEKEEQILKNRRKHQEEIHQLNVREKYITEQIVKEYEKKEKASKITIQIYKQQLKELAEERKKYLSNEAKLANIERGKKEADKQLDEGLLKFENEKLKSMQHQSKLMKLQGQSALEIHKFRLGQINAILDGEKKKLAIIKEEEAQQIRLAQIEASKVKIIQKQSDTYDSLLVRMAKAGEKERERIRLFLQIREYAPERLGLLYEEAVDVGKRKMDIYGVGAYKGEEVRNVLLEFIKRFTPERQQAITGGIAREMGVRPSLAPTKDLWNITPTTNIQAININMPKELAKLTLENIGKQVSDELLKDPMWNRWVVDQINMLTEKDVK